MKLIIEPADGVAPMLAAIKRAKKSVEIAIFRFDRKDIEPALNAAAAKGVRVTALIAFANRGGEKSLRRLELRFLAAGIIVARTSDDLVAVPRQVHPHRSPRAVRPLVQLHASRHRSQPGIRPRHEPARLSQGGGDGCSRPTARGRSTSPKGRDVRREPGELTAGARHVPEAREEAAADLRPEDLGQGRCCGSCDERAKAGVEIRVIGQVSRPAAVRRAEARGHAAPHAHDHPRPAPGLRRQPEPSRGRTGLPPRSGPRRSRSEDRRTLIDDLRVRLEATSDKRVAETADAVDDRDNAADQASRPQRRPRKSRRPSRSSRKELQPLATTVKKAVRQAVVKAGDDVLHDKDVKDTMKKVVKQAVKEAVKDAVHEAQEALPQRAPNDTTRWIGAGRVRAVAAS